MQAEVREAEPLEALDPFAPRARVAAQRQLAHEVVLAHELERPLRSRAATRAPGRVRRPLRCSGTRPCDSLCVVVARVAASHLAVHQFLPTCVSIRLDHLSRGRGADDPVSPLRRQSRCVLGGGCDDQLGWLRGHVVQARLLDCVMATAEGLVVPAPEPRDHVERLLEHPSRLSGRGHRSPRMCSFSSSPDPTPRKNRPSMSSADVAAAWATTAGWMRISGHVTAVPSRIRFVASAIAPTTLQTNGLCPCASTHGW